MNKHYRTIMMLQLAPFDTSGRTENFSTFPGRFHPLIAVLYSPSRETQSFKEYQETAEHKME